VVPDRARAPSTVADPAQALASFIWQASLVVLGLRGPGSQGIGDSQAFLSHRLSGQYAVHARSRRRVDHAIQHGSRGLVVASGVTDTIEGFDSSSGLVLSVHPSDRAATPRPETSRHRLDLGLAFVAHVVASLVRLKKPDKSQSDMPAFRSASRASSLRGSAGMCHTCGSL
jgi:hypothetical protein